MANILSIISRNTSPGLKRTADTKPDIYIMRVDADPSAGDGTEAPTGSIAIYDAPGGTTVYYKYDNLDTSWRSFLDADGLVGIPEVSASTIPNVIRVYEDGTGDAATISAAITAAVSGDVILVYPGAYTESSTIVVPSGVTLTSLNGWKQTSIDFTGNALSIAIRLESEVTLNGFDIIHDGSYSVIYNTTDSHSYMVRDCKLSGTVGVGILMNRGCMVEDIVYANTLTDTAIRINANGNTTDITRIVKNVRPADLSSLGTTLLAGIANIDTGAPPDTGIGLIIDNCYFGTDNVNGKALNLAMANAQIRISNCDFDAGGASGYAVYLSSNTKGITFENCRFSSTQEQIYFNGATHTVYFENSPFKTLGAINAPTISMFIDGNKNTVVATPGTSDDYPTYTEALAICTVLDGLGQDSIIKLSDGVYNAASGEVAPYTIPGNIVIYNENGPEFCEVVGKHNDSSNNNTTFKNVHFNGNATSRMFGVYGTNWLYENCILSSANAAIYHGAGTSGTLTIKDVRWKSDADKPFALGSQGGTDYLIRCRPYDFSQNSVREVIEHTNYANIYVYDCYLKCSRASKGVYEGGSGTTNYRLVFENTTFENVDASGCGVEFNIGGSSTYITLNNCTMICTTDILFHSTAGGNIILNDTPIKKIANAPTSWMCDGAVNTVKCTPGTTDRYPNLTEAISIASTIASTTTIIAGTGTYNEANGETFPLSIPANTTLRGAGRNNSIINRTTLTSDQQVVDINGSSITIEELQIITTGDKLGRLIATTAAADDVVLRNLRLDGGNRTIWIGTNCDNLLIDDVEFNNASRYWLLCESGLGHLTNSVVKRMRGVSRTATANACIFFGSGEHSVDFYDCDFQGSSSSCIDVRSSVAGSRVHIYGGSITCDAGGDGIWVVTAQPTVRIYNTRFVSTTYDVEFGGSGTCELYNCILAGSSGNVNFAAAGTLTTRGTTLTSSAGTPGDLDMDLGVNRVDAGATVTILITDEVVLSSYSATGIVTVNLPDITQHGPQKLTIKDSGGNAGGNNITINGAGTDAIDGAASATINTNYGSITFVKNGTEWSII